MGELRRERKVEKNKVNGIRKMTNMLLGQEGRQKAMQIRERTRDNTKLQAEEMDGAEQRDREKGRQGEKVKIIEETRQDIMTKRYTDDAIERKKKENGRSM